MLKHSTYVGRHGLLTTRTFCQLHPGCTFTLATLLTIGFGCHRCSSVPVGGNPDLCLFCCCAVLLQGSSASGSSIEAGSEQAQQMQQQPLRMSLLQAVRAPTRMWLQSFFADLRPDQRQVGRGRDRIWEAAAHLNYITLCTAPCGLHGLHTQYRS